MNKTILTILSLIFLIITSCEEAPNTTDKNGSITIQSPYEGYEFIYTGQSLEIIAKINHKDEASSAYISINNDIIASGLSDTLIAHYEPNSNINQNANIEAILLNEENQIISSDNINISINTINSTTLNSESVFMNVNDEFMMMRTPVTNRQFLNFLNTNQQLNVDIVDILWTDIAIGDNQPNGYGDPKKCEFDTSDNYEPTSWWYVNVTSNYANENIPAGEYTVYKNATNIYDSNADYSDEAGKIQYDCATENFYLPNEEYLDHPVVGVSWVGANVYANYFGWSLPTMDQWILASQGDQELDEGWIYPWNDNTIINQNYANYDNDNTSQVKHYNGLGELNLSLSAYGLYDMAGNVWEYTATPTSSETAYKKTGGAFDSESNQLEIGYEAYALWEHVSYNTGFRCIASIDYVSSPPSGCINQEACNYDSFSESSSDCFEDDCLNLCGGDTQEFTFFQDSDFDGFGNPDVSELQCDLPELGWADNSDDLDDDCFSDDIEQNNIDCNNDCNGTAYYDGCNQCVGGNTENEPCAEDCNGDEGGEAEWDDCGVCSGGNTQHEANSDMDCNNDCPEGTPNWDGGDGGTAIIDQCGICSGGNTGYEADSDIDDCGVCFGNGYQNYCIDSNQNGCCDCGNDDNGNWDECNPNTDSESLCESEVEWFDIETILGCSNSNAENYYCDQEENECFELVADVIIPPCNFIDDGSCIVYGCSDDMASNYNNEATICEDGTENNCCEYITPIVLSFGNVNIQNGTMELLITVPEYENESDYIYGFQFNIDGITISSASGGLAEENDFTISTGGNIIIGFSITGNYIGQGTGILTIVEFTPTSNEACFSLGTGAFSNENSQPIPVQFGDCYQF